MTKTKQNCIQKTTAKTTSEFAVKVDTVLNGPLQVLCTLKSCGVPRKRKMFENQCFRG